MILSFDKMELDTDRAELRRDGQVVPVEPRVFALLALLAENPERLRTRNELIEKIWGNRIISDSAISTGIKAARKAVGDNGTRQSVIKTVHGRGFRFLSHVQRIADSPAANEQSASGDIIISAAAEPERTPLTAAHEGKPSLAVLPFQLLSVKEGWAAVGDAIPAELISSLSRLRWLFVTARGSSFRFRQTVSDPTDVRDQLGVGYMLTGMVEMFGDVVTVTVELADSSEGNVLWAERYTSSLDDIHETRSGIVSGVIAALEIHIPLNEANVARIQVPENLDAWSLYHVGLQLHIGLTKQTMPLQQIFSTGQSIRNLLLHAHMPAYRLQNFKTYF